MRVLTQAQLDILFDRHENWLNNESATRYRLVLYADDDLTGLSFSGRNLKKSYVLGAKMHGVDLTDVDFSNSQMPGVDLTGADLTGATLNRCDMQGSKFEGATLTGANFSSTQLQKATFVGAVLIGVVFNRADLTDVTIDSDCDLTDVVLTDARGLQSLRLSVRELKQRGAIV